MSRRDVIMTTVLHPDGRSYEVISGALPSGTGFSLDGKTRTFYGTRRDYRILNGINHTVLGIGSAALALATAYAARHGLEASVLLDAGDANLSLEGLVHLRDSLIWGAGALLGGSFLGAFTGLRYGGLPRTSPRSEAIPCVPADAPSRAVASERSLQ